MVVRVTLGVGDTVGVIVGVGSAEAGSTKIRRMKTNTKTIPIDPRTIFFLMALPSVTASLFLPTYDPRRLFLYILLPKNLKTPPANRSEAFSFLNDCPAVSLILQIRGFAPPPCSGFATRHIYLI